jgi:hypothetical protein
MTPELAMRLVEREPPAPEREEAAAMLPMAAIEGRGRVHLGIVMFACIAIAIVLTPAALSAQEADLSAIASECLETRLSGCRVLSGGFINEDDGDRDGQLLLAWQTQTGFTPEDGVSGGFVLFAHGLDGWSVLDSGFDGWRFGVPRLNEAGLLHIPGYRGGTGAYNADRLYRLDEDDWRPVEMESWLGAIGEELPAGLEIWKGVQYDFADPWSGPIARTALWRADDANCCPTGGEAIIGFAIENDRLTVTEVVYIAPRGQGG